MTNVTDLATAAIALVALGVSLHELRASREERRIAVRPHISFRREASSEKRTFRIVMKNAGLGPAELTAFMFSVSGTQHRIARGEDFSLLLKATGINECKIDYAAYVTLGDFIPVDYELRVVDLSAISLYPEAGDLFDTNFSNLNVHVMYRSLYGEEFSASADVIAST